MSSMDEMEFHDALTDGEGGSSTASENIVQVVEASVEEVIEEVLSVTSLPNTAQNESNEPKDQEEMEMSSEPEPPTEEYSYEEQRAQFLKKIDKEQVEEIIENVETAVDRVVSEALLNSDVDVDVEDEGKISEASEVDSMKTKRDKFLERLEHSPPDEMETKREEFLEKFEHPPPNEMETKRDKFVEKVEHPPPTEMEQKRDEFMEKLEHSLSSSPPAATSSGWGSMFSALTGITTTVKATASTQMDKIYDALDPNMPEDNNDEANADSKSIRGLLDKISPVS